MWKLKEELLKEGKTMEDNLMEDLSQQSQKWNVGKKRHLKKDC